MNHVEHLVGGSTFLHHAEVAEASAGQFPQLLLIRNYSITK
ncbi:hypothetical protein HNO89_001624 [Sporosarcina luteola]|nr:hypothetical protein [Sporosarcina luteola]